MPLKSSKMSMITRALLSLAVVSSCSCFGGQAVSNRIKRATCDAVYSNINPDHSMCLDDSPNATPDPFTDTEKQRIVEQHNDYRALEDAAGMMQVVWDDDIAIVAQKWAQKCGETGAHESVSNKRSVPSLLGVGIGQNVATYWGCCSTFERATELWQAEIKDFEYGTGSKNGGVVGHYTQVVLEDVFRIGCGRALCLDGTIEKTKIVCNYAKAQLNTDVQTPFTQCADASCKVQCQTRDASGLCDCGGKICLNSGTLDKTTCTCSCRPNFSGPLCETVDCSTAVDKFYCTDANDCRFSSRLADCPNLCNICPSSCTKVCQNGGAQNTYSCTCNCAEGWTGDVCETAVTTTGPSSTTATTTSVTTSATTSITTTTTPTTSTTTGTTLTTSATPTTTSTTMITTSTLGDSTTTGTTSISSTQTTSQSSTTSATTTSTPSVSTASPTSTTTITTSTLGDSTTSGTTSISSTQTTTQSSTTSLTTTSISTTSTTLTTSTTTTTTSSPTTTSSAQSCSVAPSITNADVTVTDNTATYRCKEGFATKGGTNSVSTCENDVWSSTDLQCIDVSTCYIKNGRTSVYSGTLSTTNGGYTCQAWDSQTPNRHVVKDSHFTIAAGDDPTPTKAESSNYCRDPYGGGRLWCVTTSPLKRWDYCDNVPACNTTVPSCPEPPSVPNADVTIADAKATYKCKEGFATQSGTSSVSTCTNGIWSDVGLQCVDVSNCYVTSGRTRVYSGTLSTTNGGYTCQAWDSQTPNAHAVKDSHFTIAAGDDPTPTKAESSNYCRDPYGGGRLWCITTSPLKRWDYCDNVTPCP